MTKANWYTKWGVWVVLPILAILVSGMLLLGGSHWGLAIPKVIWLVISIVSNCGAFLFSIFGLAEEDSVFKFCLLLLYYLACFLFLYFLVAPALFH